MLSTCNEKIQRGIGKLLVLRKLDSMASDTDSLTAVTPRPVSTTRNYAHSSHENHSEVIVGHLASGAQGEVRGDNSARARKLTFTAVYLPHHRAMLEPRLRTFP
jgi:hypothetical protein